MYQPQRLSNCSKSVGKFIGTGTETDPATESITYSFRIDRIPNTAVYISIFSLKKGAGSGSVPVSVSVSVSGVTPTFFEQLQGLNITV